MARCDDWIHGISIDGGEIVTDSKADVAKAAHTVKVYIHTTGNNTEWSYRYRTRLFKRTNGQWGWGAWSSWTTVTGNLVVVGDDDVCAITGDAGISLAQRDEGNREQVQVQALNVNWGDGIWVKNFWDGSDAVYELRTKPKMLTGYQGIVSRNGVNPQIQMTTAYVHAGTFSCDGINDADGNTVIKAFSGAVKPTTVGAYDVCNIPVKCIVKPWTAGETLTFVNPKYVTPYGCVADWQDNGCITGDAPSTTTCSYSQDGYDAIVQYTIDQNVKAAYFTADGTYGKGYEGRARIKGVPLDVPIPVVGILIIDTGNAPYKVVARRVGSANVSSKDSCVIDYDGGQIPFCGSPNLSHTHTGRKELYEVAGSRLPKPFYGTGHTHAMTLSAKFDGKMATDYALPSAKLEELSDAGTCVLRAPNGGRWNCSVDDVSWATGSENVVSSVTVNMTEVDG